MSSEQHNEPIRFGLFDSGVGGLSVLRRLHQLASVCLSRSFEFIYLGDTARCPYGNRDAEEVRTFVAQIVQFLAQKNVDHVIMACNTSAAVGLDRAREVSSAPVHDLISPTAKYVASSYRRIGVMATQGTVNSRAFSSKILYHAPDAHVVEIACPKLVPLVEGGELYGEHTKAVLMQYTSELEEQEVEAVILGCTHFPFLRRAIRDLLPESIVLVDPADMLARQLVFDLGLDASTQPLNDNVTELYCSHYAEFFTTGTAQTFANTATVCLGKAESCIVPAGNVQSLPVEALEHLTAGVTPVSNVVPMPPVKPSANDSKIVAP